MTIFYTKTYFGYLHNLEGNPYEFFQTSWLETTTKKLKAVAKLEGGRLYFKEVPKLLVIIFPKLTSTSVLVQSELSHRCFVASFIFNSLNSRSDKYLISP